MIGLKQKKIRELDPLHFAAFLFAAYFVLAVLFYFLAGEQLHFRNSRGDLKLVPATSGSVELVAGTVIEQAFTVDIQRIQTVSIQWGTYYRPNKGEVRTELVDLRNGTVLLAQSLDATVITEGQISVMSMAQPLENFFGVPLLLRIFSPDSVSGSAVSPLMNGDPSAAAQGSQLYLNGIATPGTLCFSVTGQDYIWTGLHYWKLVAVGGVLLLLYLGFMLYRWKKGRKVLLLYGMVALQKYRFLIRKLVDRDFKAKYKRSVLGVFWSFLNPLLTMIVQYIVFSNLFRFDIPYYPVYLLSGIVIFNFFTESCGMALSSIVGNAGLITKVYMPKYIYPFTRVLSSSINLLISLIPLLIVTLLSGLFPTKAYLLLPFMLGCLMLFCLGLGLALAAGMVYFRDIQFLWGVLITIWVYMTPIFYPESILPPKFDIVLKINPLYYFIKFIRICLIERVSPEPIMYAQCFLFGFGALIVGSLIFKKAQDKFVLYL